MNVLVRHTVLILFVWLMLAGVCLGRQVYLKDGGIIDSQSAWRKGDKVFVKVNRDIVAEFAPNEIDLRRTFPKTVTSSRHLHRKVTAAAGTVTAKPAPTAAAPAPAVATAASKPVVQPSPSATLPPPRPAASPAPDPAPTTKESILPAAPPAADVIPQQVNVAQKMAGIPLIASLGFLAVCLLIIAAQWVVFERAGQAGWKSLVPFYNMYILMIISGKPGWWMFLLFIPLVGVVIFLFAMLSLAKKFRRSELFGVGMFFLPMIFLPLLAFGGSEYEG